MGYCLRNGGELMAVCGCFLRNGGGHMVMYVGAT